MRYRLAAIVALALSAGSAAAVTPGKDLFIPSVGRLKGACTKGVCAQFRTDVWLYNASAQGAEVTVAFLKRDTDNSTPAASHAFSFGPGQTVELADIFDTVFHLDGVAGALRIAATADVIATARVYDVNVQTNIGTGTAGQFYPGLPAELAIGPGDSTTVIGLAEQGGTWRSNLSLVETAGHSIVVNLERLDANGQVLFTYTGYRLEPFEAKQINRVLQFLGGSGTMANQRVRVTAPAPEDEGRVLVAGSRIDSRTGDPFTIEMAGEPILPAEDRTVGRFSGTSLSPQGLVDGAISFEIAQGGLTSFQGMAAVPCGEGAYVLDFDVAYAQAVPLSEGGSFGVEGAMSYPDGAGGSFTAIWTLAGTVGANGTFTGSTLLRSDISGAGGDYAACNGVTDRAWFGGWAGSAAP